LLRCTRSGIRNASAGLTYLLPRTQPVIPVNAWIMLKLLRAPEAAQRVALRDAGRCRAGAVTSAGVRYGPGSAVHRRRDAAPRPGHETVPRHSSLPGLTRQSIFFERFLRRWMDTRVKPAYDAKYVSALALNFRFTDSNSQALAFPRRRASWAFSSLPSKMRGDGAPKGAPW
jgi:hypothetical protein